MLLISSNILSLIILFPLFGCLFISFCRFYQTTLLWFFALFFSGMSFFFSLLLLFFFDKSFSGLQFVEVFHWFFPYRLSFIIGVDGISVFFIVLTAFILPLCLLIHFNGFGERTKAYLLSFLILETLLLCVFLVFNVFLFFLFFESVLLPMFLIIGLWGSRIRKIYAAYQLVLYTLFGSIFFCISMLFIFFHTGSLDFFVIKQTNFSTDRQLLLWLAFFFGFAVKVPMFPFHVWLPEAHVEAPTAGSVILAGILLKLGTYGFLRFSIPFFPQATLFFMPLMYFLSCIAIIYTSLTTLRQIDLKKIIAYSSVAHMGFVTLGLFSLVSVSIEGAIFLMLSHGLVSSALFLCVGVIYDRYKTRIYKYYSGLVQTMPVFVFFFLFFSLANLSFPGTTSFVGELFILLGIFHSNTFATVLGAVGTIFGAAYAIWIFNRVSYGINKIKYLSFFFDLSFFEVCLFFPLFFFSIFFGLYSNFILDFLHASVSYYFLGDVCF